MFAVAVPDNAFALTSVNSAGRTSVNSLPGLSADAMSPLLLMTMVYVTLDPV
jgi:hypothetical protein